MDVMGVTKKNAVPGIVWAIVHGNPLILPHMIMKIINV